MKPARFRYHDPRSLEEALTLRSQLERAPILAGGQSLLPLLNMRTVRYDDLIDLCHLDELRAIDTDGATLRLGAMVRQRTAERAAEVARDCPLLVEALGYVGFVQTRTRGTIGGSLAYLDPAAEVVAVANAMEATLEVASVDGTREIAFDAFVRSGFRSDLRDDEVLVAARLPIWPDGHGYAFEETAPRETGPTIVGVAALVALDDQGRIDRAAVALAGLGDAPIRAREVEEAVLGSEPGPSLLRDAAALVAEHAAVDGIHAPARVRRLLAVTTTERALCRAAERAKGPQDG